MPTVIYEDDNILAVNKPAGLLVHAPKAISNFQETISKQIPLPTGRQANSKKAKSYKLKAISSLVDWILDKYPRVATVGDEPSLRPGIVHRLDKETSGVLIVAKNQKAFEFLKNQFKNREIKKTYIALVRGAVKNLKGKIDTPIKRFTKSREAETEYKVIKRFSSPPSEYTLLEVYPKTGRTHQIRIHLKSIGHPIVCDKLYGGKKPACRQAGVDCISGLERHFLHASSLELTLPDNTRIKIDADMPEDLQTVLKSLE